MNVGVASSSNSQYSFLTIDLPQNRLGHPWSVLRLGSHIENLMVKPHRRSYYHIPSIHRTESTDSG